MQITNTTGAKSRGGRKPTRGRETAAAAGQLAPVIEGHLNAAAGQLALGSAGDTAVAAGQSVSVGGGEAGNGALAGEGEGAGGRSSNAEPQDVCCGVSPKTIHERLPKTDCTAGPS